MDTEAPLSRRSYLLGAGSLPLLSGIGLSHRTRFSQNDTNTAAQWSQFQADAQNSGYIGGVEAPRNPPQRRWSFQYEFTETNHNGTSPIIVEYTVFYGSPTAKLYALDLRDGSVKWETEGQFPFDDRTLAVENNTLFAGSNGDISAYAVDDGTKKWTYVPENEARKITVADGIVFSGSGWSMFALDAENGSILWKRELHEGYGPNTPVATKGNMVYIIYEDGSIYALNKESGSEEWRFEMADASKFESPVSTPTVVDDSLYIGDKEGNVYAINRNDGSKKWETEIGYPIKSSFAVANGMVFVGADDWKVYALDIEDGKEVWSYQTQRKMKSGLAATDDTVYVNSDRLYAIDQESGSSLWQSSSTYTGVSPAVAEGVIVNVAETESEGRVEAFEKSETKQTTTETTTTRTETTTNTTETTTTTTTTSTRSTTPETTTPRTETTPKEENTSITTSRSSSNTTQSNASTQNSSDQTRGFFSNSSEEPDFLSNVLNLTVIGFLMSVAGMIHQLIQGE